MKLLTSISVMTEAVVRSYALDVVDYLTKPPSFSRFELAVQRVNDALVHEKTKRTTDGQE